MKNNNGFSLIELVVVIVIIGIVGSVCLSITGHTQFSYKREYEAWCKLEHRQDVSYDEFVLLYRHGLLNNRVK